ncbi:WD40/YVTN/BNR-like repeat-containing protein [Paenibacillus radicis (ex Xue et al. 2023)]|uniref:Xyloglucanase n=1 Tax=Paenibacillus radicis (ex Xue et al. 2023) TaxID=2972489 RepID=A0ABT1YBK7_9BACL|nr:xyloglucanase [Paenibacillus radicis (ex Xue et al. 2023)]MCR8630581.1 xyloglucanase [Paenibacillus radicis (ex Xue et al. 2023)]
MLKWVRAVCAVAIIISSVQLAVFVSAESYEQENSSIKSEAYSWGRAKVVGGGFIPGIIFNKTEKDLIYARTDIGGAYRWEPTTRSWTQLMDFVSAKEWNMLGVESLATDSVDPNRLYIAAGTYTNEWTDMNGVILRSTDKGNTWKRSELPFKFGGNMPGRSMGERLVIDPNNNSVLYFGARSGNGLWRSADFGETWSRVDSFTAKGNFIDDYKDKVGVVWVTFDPATGTADETTQVLYAGVADTNQSIYRSADGGQTWEAVPGQPNQGFVPHHGVLASTGNLFITYNEGVGPYNGGKGAVWKLNTATGAWTDISPTGNTDNPYGGITVDAQHPDTVMAATMNKWWPDDFIYRSLDGGATWKSFWAMDEGGKSGRHNQFSIDYSISPWLDWGVKKQLPETSPKLGWMIGSLEIDPFNSDRLLYGTGATLYGSENLTELDQDHHIDISVYANGIEETAVLGLVSPPSGAQLLSAMGDIGGFRHGDLTSAPEMITNPYLGTSTDIDYAELNPDIVVRVGNHDGEGKGPRMGVSTDNGKTWKSATNSWTALSGDRTNGGLIAVGADSTRIVWSPEGAEGINRPVSFSTDLGATWTASQGIPSGARISSDRVNPVKFYGMHNGEFYVSVDGGAYFSKSSAVGLSSHLTSNFKAMPGVEGDIWIAAAGDNSLSDSTYGLFHSNDSGSSFTKLEHVQEAAAVGFGKAAPGQDIMALYVYGKIDDEYGAFRSDDQGITWVKISDDEHQFGAVNRTITGDPRVYGRVYLGTNGLGIVIGDIKDTWQK